MLILTNQKRSSKAALKSTDKATPNVKINYTRDKASSILSLG